MTELMHWQTKCTSQQCSMKRPAGHRFRMTTFRATALTGLSIDGVPRLKESGFDMYSLIAVHTPHKSSAPICIYS